jgi:hypothetical protein
LVPCLLVLPALLAANVACREPSNATERAAWYEGLVAPEYNGCGHVRLMLEGESGYGPNAQRLATSLIKAFFK